MNFQSAKYIGALALIVGLSACETMPADAPTGVSKMSGPFERHPLRLVIKGMSADQALGTEAAMIATLEDFDVDRPNGATLGQWIRAIRSARNDHGAKILGGPGGLSPRFLLDAAEDALDNGHYPGAPTIDVHGQIEEECEAQDGTIIPGYRFDGIAMHGSGHLCVTVFTAIQRGGGGNTRTIAERFLVIVEPHADGTGGFMVEEKTDINDPNYDPNNVFPDFATASNLRINELTAAGFDYKLWASGTSIRIARVWRDNNYDPSHPNLRPVNLHSRPYRSLQIPNRDSCIDMMFAAVPPSPTMPAGMSPPQYCLGRCDNPPIINTR